MIEHSLPLPQQILLAIAEPSSLRSTLLTRIETALSANPEQNPIKSPFSKVLSVQEKAHFKAAHYWLNQEQLEEDSSIEQVKQSLEIAYHLKQVQAWDLAGQVLFIPSEGEENLLLYQQLGNLGWFREQIDYYRPLLEKVNPSFDCFCLKEIGEAYINLCQYDLAKHAFQDLLTLARQQQLILSEAQALEGLGLCHLYLGLHQTGLAVCQQGIKVLQRASSCFPSDINLKQQLAKTLVTASFIAVYQRKYRPSGRYALAALTIAREIQDQKTKWYALTRLATCYAQQGKRKKAFQYIEQQYQTRHQIKDLRQINVMLTCYCVITCTLRKFDRAIEALEEGIQLQKQLRDTHRQYHLLSLLGYVYLWNNDSQRAIDCCKNTIIQSRRHGYKGYQAMGLAQLSYMYSDLGNRNAARIFAKRSWAITRHFDDCITKAASLAALSLVCLHEGKAFRCILLVIRSLIAVAPITSGDSKVILVLLMKHFIGLLRKRPDRSSNHTDHPPGQGSLSTNDRITQSFERKP